MSKVRQFIIQEIKSLFTMATKHHRPAHLAAAAALASALPLFVGQYFGHLDYGLISFLGGMVFLYLPGTNLVHRMVTMLCASALMTTCFFFGLVAQNFPLLHIPVVLVMALFAGILCRFFRVQPPGLQFFMMAEMVAMYLPHSIEAVPLLTGLLFLGTLAACFVAFFYSVTVLWRGETVKPIAEMNRDLRETVVDSLIIAIFVATSLAFAELLQLEKPYWVPVSCLSVIQGVSLHAVWNKQLHRIIGTALGLILAYGLLALGVHGWMVCLIMMCLNFFIEFFIVRHYAIATIFITPLTIFLVEASATSKIDATVMMQSRFIDTVFGCAFGLIGAWCLHRSRIRDWLYDGLRKLLKRFVPES